MFRELARENIFLFEVDLVQDRPPHMSKILISKIIIFMSKILRMKGSGDLNSSINRKLNIS